MIRGLRKARTVPNVFAGLWTQRVFRPRSILFAFRVITGFLDKPPELRNRDFVNAYEEWPRDIDTLWKLLRWLVTSGISSRLGLRRAHQEPARRDQVQLHADAVG